jgi:hypothetical protein
MPTTRQTMAIALLLLIFISGGIYAFRNWSDLEWPTPPPPTVTSTATSLPETGYEAVTIINAGCFDWSNQRIAEIESSELVKVLGRNKDGSWYMVRWPRFTTDCWVEAKRLKPSNFTSEKLFAIPETFPPVFTPTVPPTGKPTSTLTTIATSTTILMSITSTPTATKTPKTRIPSLTPTITVTGTPTPTYTPIDVVTPTNTATPTYTPTFTRTPTSTPTFTPTSCNRPAAPNLFVAQRGQNVDLTWGAVTDATGYEVFRSVNGGGYSSLGKINGLKLQDSLPNNDIHEYYVVAINSCGNSDHSNVKNVTR